MNLCKYKDIFGEPNNGVHKYRLFNIAIIDVIFTILFGLIIKYYYNYNIFVILFFLLIISILFHKLFCVKTTILKILNI